MKKMNSSLILFSAIFALIFSFASCNEKMPEEPVIPEVILAEGSTGTDYIMFTLVPRNAERCAYLCLKREGASLPDAERILFEGTPVPEVKVQKIRIDGLEADTEYVVIAAAEADETVVSEPIYMKTAEVEKPDNPDNPEKPDEPISQMDVAIEDVSVTYDSITFTLVPINAGEAAYDFYLKTDDFSMPHESDIFFKGTVLETAAHPETITITGLRDNSVYYVFAAVESPSSYDRVMKYVEVTTAERPGPEELPTVHFAEGELLVFQGRNYVVRMENDEYDVELDMYGSDVPDYALHMESGEYIFQKEYHGGAAWVLDSRTRVSQKQSDSNLELVKGSVSVTYENGAYTITGRLITDDNRAFNMEYTGEMSYPYTPKEGRLDVIDGKYSLVVSSDYHTMTMDFAGTELVGTHSLDSGLEGVRIQVSEKDAMSWRAESAEFEITSPIEDNYMIAGTMLLGNGDKVTVLSESISVIEPEKPGVEEIVFTRNSAYGGPDMTGWQSAYALTLENDEWSFYFEFDCSGYYDELPTGKLIYVSWGGGEIGGYRITKGDSEYKDIDEGFIDITKDGSTYTIQVEMTRDNGEVLKGVYTGTVDCIDMSGSGY